MKDRYDDPSHHKQMLYYRATSCSICRQVVEAMFNIITIIIILFF